MPEIKVKHLVSCSSEDSTHKAENLLRHDTYRKWKCGNTAERYTSAILQFEKAEIIHSVDVGNEGSAFVELLVGNSTCASDQAFEVLLVSSSFMSPTESRNGTNINRVRMFGPDQLVRTSTDKRWDLVKVVCSQPYNKNLAHGLSFIKFHSKPIDDKSNSLYSPRITKLGQFMVKDEEGISNSLKPGSLFFNRTNKSQPSSTAVVASASNTEQPRTSYAAGTLQASGILTGAPAPAPAPAPSASRDQTIPQTSPVSALKEPTPGKKKLEVSRHRGSPSTSKPSPVVGASGKASSASVPPAPHTHTHTHTHTEAKRKRGVDATEEREKEREKEREGRAPLEGTVFVLSGFQNPSRSQLRDKALSLGGKYRAAWGPDCTHLICAFANTPKYSQVKAQGGIVVRKDWILDCFTRKKYISYRRYLLDGAEASSEDEEGESVMGGQRAPTSNKPAPAHPQASQKETRTRRTKPPNQDFEASTDEDVAVSSKHVDNDSGCDTEDELRQVRENNRKRQRVRDPEINPYNVSTDENTDTDEDRATDLPIPPLPDLFEGKRFLLYGEFPDDEHRVLIRYITAFNGYLEDYMSNEVNFVITAQDWDQDFDDALTENASLTFVKPRWIYTCNERQKLVPHQPYVVVPQI